MLRILQRSSLAIFAAGVIALWLRLNGSDTQTTPEAGGWRELRGKDFQ